MCQKGREGKGREGKGREGKGRGKSTPFGVNNENPRIILGYTWEKSTPFGINNENPRIILGYTCVSIKLMHIRPSEVLDDSEPCTSFQTANQQAALQAARMQ